MSLPALDVALLEGRVAHQRLFPREHSFNCGIFYRAEILGASTSRFKTKDHGYRDDRSLQSWANDVLDAAGLKEQINKVMLLAMPRVLGYVFNPVSFWFCLDKRKNLRAVLCEVNNTFGESHTYVCSHADQRSIVDSDWLEGEKVFHVSPFMDREGKYRFRFSFRDSQLAILINYFDAQDRLKLRTSLSGSWLADTLKNRIVLLLKYPLVTLRAIGLIHYHAARLALKKVTYRPKPNQLEPRLTYAQQVSANHQVTKEKPVDDQ